MSSAGKKSDESLRPLSEREIQQKLYGSYFQTQSAVEEKTEKEFIPPARKTKSLIREPEKIRNFTLPKIKVPKVAFKFPWREVLSLLLSGIRALVLLSKTILARTVTGWGISVVVVTSLFLGIYWLNAYRATAMKTTKPTLRIDYLQKKNRHEKPHAAKKEIQPKKETQNELEQSQTQQTLLIEAPLKTPTPETRVPEAQIPAANGKPYVIQICTYSKQEDAQKLLDEINRASLSGFTRPLQRANGKTYYAVFLGRFATFTEAQSQLREFRKKPLAQNFPDSFVRAL